MRKTKKLAAVMAVALGVGITPYAHAKIELESNSRGDALLFPVFYGYGENYFTISNNSSLFVQGHIRFRGSVWSGELLDFDVILTPYDVFVFRLADVDGDGLWEVDQSFDLKNFEYTGMLKNCIPEGGVGVARNNCMDQSNLLIPEPTDTGPDPKGSITPALIDRHRNLGYVEFIGEGVLNGMTHARMDKLIDPKLAGQLTNAGQRAIGNRLGTSLWSWVLSDGSPTGAPGNGDRLPESDIGPFVVPAGAITPTGANIMHSAGDVPNALSGTAFLTQVGQSYGLAYNAEALVNFRTNNNSHRVDNYSVAVNMIAAYPPAGPVAQTGVILHTEDAGVDPRNFSYVYGYEELTGSGAQWGSPTTNAQEARISFNNTWGPTLADGDDYTCLPAGNVEWADFRQLRWTGDAVPGCANDIPALENHDSWDFWFAGPNSIAEVEEAIRKATVGTNYPTPSTVVGAPGPDASSPRQFFTSFYFDGARFDKACEGNGRQDDPLCSSTDLQSWYFAFFPTKFFYGEDVNQWTVATIGAGCPTDPGCNEANQLMGRRGYLRAAVEHLIAWAKPFRVGVWDISENSPGGTCDTSPCILNTKDLLIREELAVFNIDTIKDRFGSGVHQDWKEGRVSLQVRPEANVCAVPAIHATLGLPNCTVTYPGLMYTFDWASDGALTHWRPMER